MTDHFLRFPDEATANEVLFDEDKVPRYTAVDVIGTIYKPTGKFIKAKDPDGGPLELPEMEPVPGWHANVRHEDDAPELAEWAVFPATPERVWF